MNQYQKKTYQDITNAQWRVINRIFYSWKTKKYVDDFYQHESAFIFMLTIAINDNKLTLKVYDALEQYLPSAFLYKFNLGLIKNPKAQIPAKEKRYYIGLLINNLIYYMNHAPACKHNRIAPFSSIAEAVIKRYVLLMEAYQHRDKDGNK